MGSLKEFIKADKAIKHNEAIKKANKDYVVELIKRCDRLGVTVPGVTFSEASRFEFIDEEVYKWVESKVSLEILEGLTDVKKTINLERLKEAYLNGLIDTVEMDSSCYREVKYNVVRVK